METFTTSARNPTQIQYEHPYDASTADDIAPATKKAASCGSRCIRSLTEGLKSCGKCLKGIAKFLGALTAAAALMSGGLLLLTLFVVAKEHFKKTN